MNEKHQIRTEVNLRNLRLGQTGLQVVVNIDGASRGNPGPAAIGVTIGHWPPAPGHATRPLCEISKAIGVRTNNQAEYMALLEALQALRDLRPESALIRTDSELLFRQITGRYRIRNPGLAELAGRIQVLLRDMPGVSFEQVARRDNLRADRLANQALDKAEQPKRKHQAQARRAEGNSGISRQAQAQAPSASPSAERREAAFGGTRGGDSLYP